MNATVIYLQTNLQKCKLHFCQIHTVVSWFADVDIFLPAGTGFAQIQAQLSLARLGSTQPHTSTGSAAALLDRRVEIQRDDFLLTARE